MQLHVNCLVSQAKMYEFLKYFTPQYMALNVNFVNSVERKLYVLKKLLTPLFIRFYMKVDII